MAGNRGHDDSHRALEKRYRAYCNVHEAEDLPQAFFERLLEKQYLADADPVRHLCSMNQNSYCIFKSSVS